ncbi:MAG TPA: outer membrane lipoprotein-sorting protein [Acidobacteriota bacterium]
MNKTLFTTKTQRAARVFVIFVSLWFILCFAHVNAASALEMMQKVDQQARSHSEQHLGSLEVHDKGGKVLKKAWQSWRTGFGGNSKIIVRFTAPAEVRGVGLLIINHTRGSSDQWLYTPSIQRERRIAPQDRSVRFLGTDFSYEDMEQRDINDSEYELLAEETLTGSSVYKIKATPKKDVRSQYSFLFLWVDKNTWVIPVTEFYTDGKLIKKLFARSVEKIQNIWTPQEFEMQDVRRSSRTIIRLSGVQYNQPVSDDIFTLRSLRSNP